MSGRADDTFALAYRDLASGQWWFIPTVPVARSWRGAFTSELAMRVAAQGELGTGVTIIETKCRPAQLDRLRRSA